MGFNIIDGCHKWRVKVSFQQPAKVIHLAGNTCNCLNIAIVWLRFFAPGYIFGGYFVEFKESLKRV